jgi:type I restriction enzyme S subunit
LTNKKVNDGELPKGWKPTKISEVVTFSSLKHQPIKQEELFYIGLEHIEKHTGKLTSKVGIEKITTIKNKFSKGDILYGKLRPNLNKVYLSNEEGVCSTDILVLKLSNNCLGEYLHHTMLSTNFVNEMSENTSGVNLPRVSTKFIMNYEIPLPTIKEQYQIIQEIESRLSVADKMEESISQSLQQAEALRQSILKKAFEGKLV